MGGGLDGRWAGAGGGIQVSYLERWGGENLHSGTVASIFRQMTMHHEDGGGRGG